MGAWGYDIHDNDTALDVRDELSRLKKGRKLTNRQTIISLLIQYEAQGAYVLQDVDGLLALVDLALAYRGVLTIELLARLESTVLAEGFESWNSPEMRRDVYERLLSRAYKTLAIR